MKIGELNFDMERILEDLKQTVNDGLSCLGCPDFGFLTESEGKLIHVGLFLMESFDGIAYP